MSLAALRLQKRFHMLTLSNPGWHLFRWQKQNIAKQLTRSAIRRASPTFPIIGICIRLFLSMVWPIKAVLGIYATSRKYALGVKQLTGKKISVQVNELLRFSLIEGLPPSSYFRYRLYDSMRWEQRGQFLLGVAPGLLFPYLNRIVPTGIEDMAILNDKEIFSRYCVLHNLGTPQLLSIFRDGSCVQIEPNESIKKLGCDLFLKPFISSRGEGIRRYLHCDGGYRIGGRELSLELLVGEAISASKLDNFLLQQGVRNARSLEKLIGDPPVVIRAITYRNAEGAVSFLAANLEVPVNDADKGNSISAYCQTFPMNKEDGSIASSPQTLNSGVDTESPPFLLEQNPMPFPCWQEIKLLAIKAHEPLKSIFSVGWDIVLTDQGPQLLEGNVCWRYESLQFLHDLPLGGGEFGNAMLAWVRKSA